jgi:hypothetical protein
MDSLITNANREEVAGRQSSPFTGKLSARPAGKPGTISSSRRICDDLFRATTFPLQRRILSHSVCVFQAWRNLSVRCGFKVKTKPWGGTVPPPDGRPRAQVKERVGRTTPFSSSAMSSGRLFLDRVGRHQSPSPLHRQPQNNMHSAEPRAKGDISTLPGRGHFYFALTPHCPALRRMSVRDKLQKLRKEVRICYTELYSNSRRLHCLWPVPRSDNRGSR